MLGSSARHQIKSLIRLLVRIDSTMEVRRMAHSVWTAGPSFAVAAALAEKCAGNCAGRRARDARTARMPDGADANTTRMPQGAMMPNGGARQRIAAQLPNQPTIHWSQRRAVTPHGITAPFWHLRPSGLCALLAFAPFWHFALFCLRRSEFQSFG